MLAQRRKLLQYLRRSDFGAYSKMLSALGLKDRYMKQASQMHADKVPAASQDLWSFQCAVGSSSASFKSLGLLLLDDPSR